MNDEAYRIFALTRGPVDDRAARSADVLTRRPDVVRACCRAPSSSATLPNRAELRLKDIDRVDRLHALAGQGRRGRRDRRGDVLQDLTQVEAAGGTRAAARSAGVARRDGGRHRPRAEEPAGRHRGDGRAAAAPGAGLGRTPQSLLADIISEAKLANAIVVEMLEFVRPDSPAGRADRSSRDVLHQAMTLAESKAPRGEISCASGRRADAADDRRAISTSSVQVFTNLLTNAFEALDGRGNIAVRAVAQALEQDPALRERPARPDADADRGRDRRRAGRAAGSERPDLRSVLHDQAAGTGLGSPIVRKIVDAHDGRIDLDERAGTGHAVPDHACRFRAAPAWFK